MLMARKARPHALCSRVCVDAWMTMGLTAFQEPACWPSRQAFPNDPYALTSSLRQRLVGLKFGSGRAQVRGGAQTSTSRTSLALKDVQHLLHSMVLKEIQRHYRKVLKEIQHVQA